MKRRLAAVLLGCLGGLAVAEIGLRVASLWAPEQPVLVERVASSRAAQIRRWPETDTSGPRLVVVGDSYTFGHGVPVDQAYPALLAQNLAARDVTVVSYSQSGWNTRRELRSLEDDFDLLAPDLLILGYCLNDAEPRPTSHMLAARPDLVPWRPQGFLQTRLARHSRLYLRLRQAADSLRLRPALHAYYRGLYDDPENLAAWRHALDKLGRLASRRSVPPVLVVFPIFDSDLDSEYAYRDLHGEVAAIARELGFHVLDLLPAYADRRGRDLALVPYSDPHPSPLAHAIAARAIAGYLEGEGLLESTPRGRARRAP